MLSMLARPNCFTKIDKSCMVARPMLFMKIWRSRMFMRFGICVFKERSQRKTLFVFMKGIGHGDEAGKVFIEWGTGVCV